MTVFIVHPAFPTGEPEAVYFDPAKAHADVMKRPGKFNRWEITELEVIE